MPENTTPEDDFNLDEWLDNSSRTVRATHLYANMALKAEIDLLQDELEAAKRNADNPDDRSYSDVDPVADLESRIDELWGQLGESKREFRVQNLIDEELDEINDHAIENTRDAVSEVTKKAREEAFKQAKREQLSSTETNQFVRVYARQEASKVIERERGILTLSKALVKPTASPDMVRKLYAKLGDAQVNLLFQAYEMASKQTPVVTVPKSQTPSTGQAGQEHS